MDDDPKNVYLFTTCLVDQVFPEVGAAVVRLLRRAGVEVVYPEGQVCCGQPFFNSGFLKEARDLAQQTIELLADADAVVIPSGSCTLMIRHEYPQLFSHQPEMAARAKALASKTFELTEFLVRFPMLFSSDPDRDHQPVTYHDSCHMCRGLGVRQAPRKLLQAAGYRIEEMEESDRCCGFGGVFFARMPELSEAMAEEKLLRSGQSGSCQVVTADPGCLMRMRQSESQGLHIRHIAEVLEEASR